MLQIRCKNNNVTKSFPEGTSLLDIYQEFEHDIQLPYPVVSAKVNNVSQGLKFRVYNSRDVEFLDIRDTSARHVYCRSLCFLLYKASQDLFLGSKLNMEHFIANGFYCIRSGCGFSGRRSAQRHPARQRLRLRQEPERRYRHGSRQNVIRFQGISARLRPGFFCGKMVYLTCGNDCATLSAHGNEVRR